MREIEEATKFFLPIFLGANVHTKERVILTQRVLTCRINLERGVILSEMPHCHR